MNEYKDQGYCLVRGLLSTDCFRSIEYSALQLIAKNYKAIGDLNDREWVVHATENSACVTKIYDEMRDNDTLIELGKRSCITEIVRNLIQSPMLYGKIPFRIDVPLATRELALWHQDDFYVNGSDQELTVWIPLYNVSVLQGPLQVMPRSHKNGKIPHNIKIGKKYIPSSHYDNEIRLVEMNRGDALFFSSFLLHSSSLNISDVIRYSIQLRYTTALNAPSDKMKGVINV